MRARVGLVAAAAIIAAVTLMSIRTLAQPPGSPHETVKAAVAGADISIEYGRPYMRGRKIMGGLVPYGRVWRTGADAATTLTTSKALVIGGTTVPAGKITLYTLPGEDQWKLILNKQTGQWGTEYDQSKDLARVDLTKKALTAPVEQLTIAIEPGAGNGGTLKISWETTELSVPFTVKG
jgi:Protein of unknown function (DUF2911)